MIINNKKYHLPNELNDFQVQMYVHLIDWKWNNLTKQPAKYRGQPYDAILPKSFVAKHYPLYRPIVDRFLEHRRRFPFKYHKFIGHMASSQAACANLFLPILKQPEVAAKILSAVKPDMKRIATDYLDQGYRIEFWDEPDNMLNDHNQVAGTDSDIAIAYYDKHDALNLWLIEHKLTEKEFTPCRGIKSKGRTKAHNCESIKEIMANPAICYYHRSCGYKYWDITLGNPKEFPVDSLLKSEDCPFKGGTNQLWRNYLLALAVENSDKWPYKKVFFSVVYHPKNPALAESISSFEAVIGNPSRFSNFPSNKLTKAASDITDPFLEKWLSWYEDLYYL